MTLARTKPNKQTQPCRSTQNKNSEKNDVYRMHARIRAGAVRTGTEKTPDRINKEEQSTRKTKLKGYIYKKDTRIHTQVYTG